MRKQFKLMTDAENRTFFKDGLNRHQYYTDDKGDMHCIETSLNVYTAMLNEKHDEIKQLKKQIKSLLSVEFMDMDSEMMTKNRFSYEGKYVSLDDGLFVTAQTINDAELISKTFNQLYNENRQLEKGLISQHKLFVLKQFLEDIGLDARFRNDGKLYLINTKGKETEIQKKCDELGIDFIMEQQPVYEPKDRTFKREINGFSRLAWFKVRE